MAQDVLKNVKGDNERIISIFRRCLTRPPAEERATEMLHTFLEKQRACNSGEAAAWTALARAVLNFDETVTQH